MSSCACLCSGKSDYIEPAKRAHIMAAPRGRGGRGGFGQNLNRPHDIFRQRKQNTSRPPSMHVDDFVAAEFKDITTPLGLLPPKRPPKSSPKPPTRGLFTGNRGRGTFHSQTRFFTPPQPKGVLLSGTYTRTHAILLRKKNTSLVFTSSVVKGLGHSANDTSLVKISTVYIEIVSALLMNIITSATQLGDGLGDFTENKK